MWLTACTVTDGGVKDMQIHFISHFDNKRTQLPSAQPPQDLYHVITHARVTKHYNMRPAFYD